MTAAVTLATAYAHGPGKEITVRRPPRPQAEPGRRIPLTELARDPFGAAVARLLVDVLSPARWEQWNLYNDHRAYPSPRAAYLVDVAVVTDGRRHLVDAVRRALIGPSTPDLVVRDPTCLTPLRPTRSLAALSESPNTVQYEDFPPPCQEPRGSTADARQQDHAPLGGAARLEFVLRRDRLSAGYGEFGDALVDLETGHLAGALVEHAHRLGLRAVADARGVTLSNGVPGPGGKPPARSSGIGPRGLSADPRPLPENAFRAFVAAVADLPAGTLTHPGLRHRLAVRNVTGVVDGWYAVSSGCELVRAGAAMDAVAATYGHPRSIADVAGMNLALVTTADIPAAVAAEGSGAYRDLLRAAGACAQHACSAAGSAGMFCRPIRSVDEPPLEAAAAAPLSHSLLYVLLAGRQRVSCFPYDLTPLELP